MNCIDKMYKEIEEILKKEKAEYEHLRTPIKEIKHDFTAFDNEVEESKIEVDYLSNANYDESVAQKKYFNEEKAVKFIEFIFKKYAVTVTSENGEDKFASEVLSKISTSDDLIEKLKALENEFVNNFYETDEVKAYFENPYNALFKDEKGYYAVILNGKFSDVKRPQSFIANQVKKLVKESLDEYVSDYAHHFKGEKEVNSILNSVKAEINKSNQTGHEELEKVLEDSFYAYLSKKGVKREEFDSYLLNKGLKLTRQGNNYFRKKAYEKYAEYKKIEFRYWFFRI